MERKPVTPHHGPLDAWFLLLPVAGETRVVKTLEESGGTGWPHWKPCT